MAKKIQELMLLECARRELGHGAYLSASAVMALPADDWAACLVAYAEAVKAARIAYMERMPNWAPLAVLPKVEAGEIRHTTCSGNTTLLLMRSGLCYSRNTPDEDDKHLVRALMQPVRVGSRMALEVDAFDAIRDYLGDAEVLNVNFVRSDSI